MEIVEGKVSNYNGHGDIFRFYGKIDGEIKYYFLDYRPLSNGNMIATTELVEAIDSEVEASHVGLVDKDGNVVIPLENKTVKPITGDILLVERLNPLSQNILDAIAASKDPKSAAGLVSVTNTCKNKVMEKIGGNQLVFHNQLSEASIFDINGHNLVSDEYFSFIGVNGDKIYLGKNTIDSQVVEYSMLPSEVQANAVVEDNKVEEAPINVENTVNNSEEIKNAVEEATASSENVANENEEVNNVQVEEKIPVVNEESDSNVEEKKEISAEDVQASVQANMELPVGVNVVPPVAAIPSLPDDDSDKVLSDLFGEASKDSSKNDEDSLNNEDNLVDEISNIKDDNKMDVFSNNVVSPEEVDSMVSKDISNEENDSQDEIDRLISKDKTSMISSDEVNDYVFKNDDKQDIFSSVSFDKIEKDDGDNLLDDKYDDKLDSYIDNDYSSRYQDDNSYSYQSSFNSRDDVLSNAGRVMGSLIDLNRKQKSDISRLNSELDKVNNSSRMKTEKIEMLEGKLDAASDKVRNLDSSLSKLESKTSMLSNKVDDQKRLIESQTRELNSKDREIEELRRQLQGKEELAKFIADAQSLLGQNEY